MSAGGPLVRLLRSVTDPIVPLSFNRMGFALNRRGFHDGDLPADADGRVALVTGANSGIGRAASLALAKRGFEVWLLCRDRARGEEARTEIAQAAASERVHLAVIDMARLASIRDFVASLPGRTVDVLVHNAGVLPHDKTLTEDGVELTFATNVLGPFALTARLLPRLTRSADARVVFVSSGGMYAQRLDLAMPDVPPERFDGTRAYANAKRAQVILARMMAEREAGAGITFASMHPGWADTTAVRTSLPRFYATMKGFLRTAEEGADTVVWLAASPRPKGTRGGFWFDRRVAMQYPFPWTRESKAGRERLFAFCEEHSAVAFGAKEAA